MNRRAWMLGVVTTCWSARAYGQQQQPTKADEREIKLVNERAAAATPSLDQFRHNLSAHYLGVGNSGQAWMREALRLCEDLAEDYRSHFRKKGFNVEFPKSRMTVVVLVNPESFAAYLGTKPEEAVGGVYDLETNRLVIFDNRAREAGLPQTQARANTVSLLHEATHQLTFNTGLLDREADVPLLISEGLGTYGEVRRPKGQNKDTKVGDINQLRLQVLLTDHSRKAGAGADKERKKKKPAADWIPFQELIEDDELFADPDDQQLAYAQSWLTIHYFLHNPDRLPQFQAYLKTIRKRKDAKSRVKDAKEAFGDLDVLDKDLRTYLSQKKPRRN